ncbi:GDSL-type esterase/lipase family protein [Nonomuraea sp. NPDC049152]|uniref:SGNH/GDSL hydrolase family protein n=1 Tax=Nonomuraea sp. NPDC049152 TaxID=3154350 RepID=UPI0034023E47
MKKKIILGLCLLLAAALATTGTVGYLTFLRPPDHAPAELCAHGHRPDARPRVVAAGASMTQGALGADWVGSLRAQPEHQGYAFINAGINGNTSADLRRRVEADIVACHPAAVTILIGTNDVRNGVPLDQYRDNLAAIIDRLKSRTTARIALMSLPPLGEDLDTAINGKLAGYNAAIKEIAHQAQVDYLPVHERLADHLRPQGGRQPYAFSFPLAFAVAAQHYLLRRGWDEIARAGGREFLVDHVHLSDRGAAIITGLTSHWLSTAPNTR